jgi:hypothetical protein
MMSAIVVATLQGTNPGGSATITETGGTIAFRALGLSHAELLEDHPRCS